VIPHELPGMGCHLPNKSRLRATKTKVFHDFPHGFPWSKLHAANSITGFNRSKAKLLEINGFSRGLKMESVYGIPPKHDF
jgi:hypothetical protein